MVRFALAGTVFLAVSLPAAAQAQEEWYLIRSLGPNRECTVVNRKPLAGEQLVPGTLDYGERCEMLVTAAQQDPASGAFTSRLIAE